MAGIKRGLHLGHFWDEDARRFSRERYVYEGERHAILFGPSGTGKGTRFLMVNLLSDCLDDRSIIVIDPKGELAAVTALHRSMLRSPDGAEHQVKILDPFGKLHEAVKDSPGHRELVDNGLTISAGFDPFTGLDLGTEQRPNLNFYDDAAALGEALIKIQGDDPHWTESAQGLVTGLVMWEKFKNGDNAKLENVREMLTVDEYDNVLGPDKKTEKKLVRGLQNHAEAMVKRGGFQIASLAGRFTNETDEIASIRSTADTQTRWILSQRMQDDLKRKPGIDFAQLKRTPTTVYVILPAERLRTHSAWLRLIIVSALRALYRPGGLRTLMMIDEMAALGHLAPLEDAFGLVRGYGVQIAGFLQDLGQLKELYEDRWESFLANSGVVQGLTPNDLTTAEWMSKRSGQQIVKADSVSAGTGTAPGGTSTNQSLSTQEIERPVFFPHELFGFKPGTGLVWIAGSGIGHSIKFEAAPYFELAQCKARASPNPYRNT